MSHYKVHSFTGSTDHNFTGLITNELLRFNGSGITSSGLESSFARTTGGTANYLTKWDPVSGYIKDSNIYDINNNIGIGTITPSEKLEVTGSILMSGGLTAVTGTIQFGALSTTGDTKTLVVGPTGELSAVTVSSSSSSYYNDHTFVGGTVLTVTHSLALVDPKSVIIQTLDASGRLFFPDDVNNYATNSIDIKCSVSGTYRVIIK